MYDTQKINLVTLKQLENLFNVEKSNFNNLTYQPFKNSYLNVCSNVCVSKMAENLNMMYEQIQTSYGNISNWWNEYISNTEGLENSIATKTLIGGITESGLSSFISTHLCNFTIYNTNILELNNYLKPTNINEVESKNAEESNLLETAADYTITGIGSFLFGVLDVVEQIGDGVIMLGGTVASLVASDKEAVQEWTKNVISYDWTDAGYDALVDFADVDEDIAYGTLHNVTQAAGTMVGYAALTYLTAGAGTAIAGTGTGATAVAATIKTALDAGIGYMAASGEASQRAFNNGATYQEAFVSSQVSGAMGAVSGVALDKLGVAAKGGQGILPKVGYAVAGMGVAAAEPVVNNVVDYNLYAKDMVNETGNKVYNNFGDYYVKSGGLTNTLMAGGIGAASVSLQGLSKKISDVDNPNRISNFDDNNVRAISKDIDEKLFESDDIITDDLFDYDVKNDEGITLDILKSNPDNITDGSLDLIKGDTKHSVSSIERKKTRIKSDFGTIEDLPDDLFGNKKWLAGEMRPEDSMRVKKYYGEKILGIDFENIPDEMLSTGEQILNPHKIETDNSIYRYISVEDIAGSTSRPLDSWLEVYLYESGYRYSGGAMRSSGKTPLEVFLQETSGKKVGEAGNINFSSVPYYYEIDGKFYVGGDGNHRTTCLKLQYLSEKAKIPSDDYAALAALKDKYTILVPVHKLS